MKTNLLKKIMSLALSAAMIFSMTASSFAAGLENSAPTQTPAQTTSPAETSDKTVTATVTQTGAANNDELFDQYVEGMFYGGGVQTYASSVGRDSLNATGVEIYEAIKSKILTIADGTTSSTVFSDIPLNIKPEDFDGAFGKAIDALLQDCPSELYWYDKTVGTASALSYSETKTDCFLTIKMAVANSYRKDGNQYATDSTKIAAAKKAFDNARSIASSATGSDADKLKTFKDKICEMVSYDTKAASGGAYGDSFQLTNVFDGDKNTNVVCEGYAKAFQYLCELSGIECYTVTGKMAGGTGAGPHMWNIVRLDDKSYVVDVTNCDAGTIGAPDKLFLKGVTMSGSSYKVAGVTYTYDSETTSLLSSSILTPSTTDYGASVDVGLTYENGVLTIKTQAGMDDWAVNGRTANAAKVTTVKIESGVTTIADEAFSACTKLTSVEMPSVTSIGNNAFGTCLSLKSITLPETLKTIGEQAFYKCEYLNNITIPASVTSIGNSAFVSCIRLESVTMEGTNPPTIGSSVFDFTGISVNGITVPESSVNAYKTAWGTEYANLIKSDHTHAGTLASGKPATCTTDGFKDYYTCSCNKFFEDKDCTKEIADLVSWKLNAGKIGATGHTAGEAWTSDNTDHWHICTVCNQPVDKATHTPGESWKFDDTNHWHECVCGNKSGSAAHDWDEGKVTIQPTETTSGVKTFTCTTCKATKEETLSPIEHTHNLTHVQAKDPTCTTNGNIEYYACTCGKWFSDAEGKTEITEADTVLHSAHKLTKVEAKPATCTVNGNTEYYTCSDCGKWFSDANGAAEITDKNSVVIPAAHKLTKVDAKPATCTKEGNIEHYKCTSCGNLFRDANGTEETDANSVIIPMAAHKLEVFAAKEPTCELDGNIAYQTCSVCKKFFSEDGKTEITLDSTVLSAKGHSFSTEWSHDDNNHWHPATCEHTDEVSEKAAHAWNAGVITTEPTETTTGVKTYTCTVCSRTKTETVPVTTHEHKPAADWSSDNASHWHSCSGCEEKLDFNNHSFNDWVVTNPPTEHETGIRERSCAVCGFKEIETVPQITHTHDLEHIAAVKSTCNKEGSVEHYHCKKCGKNYSDSTATNELASITIPTDSNNHTGGTELRGDKKATCRVNGYTGDTYCLGCNTLLSYGTTIYASPSGHKYVGGRCRYCGILQFPFMYRPVITYLNDSFHFFNGMSRMHSPNSHGLYSDGVYEWYVCAECGHEYGRTKVTIPEVNIDDDDSVDLIVDDPVQCGSDELLYIAG